MSAPEPQPAVAAAFGPQLDTARRYVGLLVTAGAERGLIGPREHDRIWDRHLVNSATLAPLLPEGATAVDIGSGAGLPGIPLAILRPDLEIELLEPMQRRVDFLIECADTLELANLTVRRGRAPVDLPAGRDVVAVTRAVAPLDGLISATRPLLDRDGTLLALKGRGASGEIDTVRQQKLPVALELLSPSFAGQHATVVRVHRLASPPSRRSPRTVRSAS